jgi:transposase
MPSSSPWLLSWTGTLLGTFSFRQSRSLMLTFNGGQLVWNLWLFSPSFRIIDSQSAKSAEGGEKIGFDGGRQVRGRKRTRIIDTLGLVVLAKVAAANTAEVHAGKEALLDLKSQPELIERLKKILADGGYRGDLVTWVKDELHADLEIVLRLGDRKSFQVLPVRWVIERTNAWVTRNLRLARDYERLAETVESFIIHSYDPLGAPSSGPTIEFSNSL